MHISCMKLIDRLIGTLIIRVISAPIQGEPRVPLSSCLIIRPGGIGDAVLLAPVIRQLKVKYPNIQITILAERRNAGVFAQIPSVDLLYCYDRPAEFWHAVCGKYDVVIDTEQWHRLSAVVARLAIAPIKIGFDTNERRRMFTHVLPYSHDDYEVDSFLRLLQPLGLDHVKERGSLPWLKVSGEAEKEVSGRLEPVVRGPFITLFPGASIPERRWGADRFKAVAAELAQKGYGIVVVGGALDLADAQTIAGESDLNLAGKTSLAETAAVLARSALLVSGDSGVLHIAVGLGIPTVSLFGPGRALKWAPRGEHHIVINKGLPCSPCTTFGTTPPCPCNARCMQEITVAEVVTHCLKQLEHPAG